ncbi:4-hydroxy-tetrahydrodipicolinate reductase [soil metagenome]
MIKLAVFGAGGRMGRAIVRLAAEGKTFTVVRAIDGSATGDAGLVAGTTELDVPFTRSATDLGDAEAVIDFSAPGALPDSAEAAAAHGAAFVSGTTGLDSEGLLALDACSARVPTLWEPNMSVGVHVLGELLRRAIAMLGESFDIEIVEAHHKRKLDAPSGTAKRLAEIAKDARGGGRYVHGREGKAAARGKDDIGVLAIRGCDVIGDHHVHLLGEGERIELVHRASSRELFAAGALRAAAWLVGKPAGRYGLEDVLRS